MEYTSENLKKFIEGLAINKNKVTNEEIFKEWDENFEDTDIHKAMGMSYLFEDISEILYNLGFESDDLDWVRKKKLKPDEYVVGPPPGQMNLFEEEEE